jgi:hypothetical protein
MPASLAAARLVLPVELFSQSCVNIAGLWQQRENATLRCTVTVAGETDTYTDPLSASGTVTINQTQGSCSFTYDPGTIGAGRVIQ